MKLEFEGHAKLAINTLHCVCGFCGNHDTENAVVELNFREKKIYYLCSKCKKNNELVFGNPAPPPLPRTRLV